MELTLKYRLHRLNLYCDKVIEIFVYMLIFCLPFSKAIIEISATFIILAWITKRILSYQISLEKGSLLGFIKAFNPVPTYLNIPIILYMVAAFLSVIFSSNFSLSLKNFGSKSMEYILLYFIIAEFAYDKRRLKNTVIVMLVSAAMIGVDCIFQYFFGFDFLRHRTFEAGRVTGCFQMPGDLAGYLAPILCLPFALSFLKLKKWIKNSLRIGTILLLTLLIFTVSRGAWFGFAIAIFFLGILENKKILYTTIAFLLVLGVIMPHLIETSGNILARLKNIVVFSDTSDLDRKAIWQVALQMIKDKPLFGQGLTTFMGNFMRFAKEDSLKVLNLYYIQEGIIPYAHNCYLQIAAETGIVGLVSFLTLIGTFFIHTIMSLSKIKDRFYHAVLSGISAGIIATLVHSAVDTNLYSLQLSVLFWVMLGLNAALQRDFALGKNKV